MLCYVMLCYVMLCYAMLCYVMLCECSNGGRITMVSMSATNWQALVKTVAVSVVYLTMLNLLLGNTGRLSELGTTCRSLGMQYGGWVKSATSSNCLISQNWLASIKRVTVK